MVERETYIDGTFMLSKSHILLGGPVDYHNEENNQRLSERLEEQGYDNGVLLQNEYTAEYPHVQGTIGFAASSSGPVFYINLVDNTVHHGEMKDPCFGRFVRGFDLLERMAGMPKNEDGIFELPIYIVRMEVVEDVE
jgi:cyclophilin family peptidyl-prolyl cis-trans isomerase